MERRHRFLIETKQLKQEIALLTGTLKGEKPPELRRPQPTQLDPCNSRMQREKMRTIINEKLNKNKKITRKPPPHRYASHAVFQKPTKLQRKTTELTDNSHMQINELLKKMTEDPVIGALVRDTLLGNPKNDQNLPTRRKPLETVTFQISNKPRQETIRNNETGTSHNEAILFREIEKLRYENFMLHQRTEKLVNQERENSILQQRAERPMITEREDFILQQRAERPITPERKDFRAKKVNSAAKTQKSQSKNSSSNKSTLEVTRHCAQCAMLLSKGYSAKNCRNHKND